MFFRVRVQGPGSGSGSRVQVQGSGPESRSRVRVQGSGSGSRVRVQVIEVVVGIYKSEEIQQVFRRDLNPNDFKEM